MRQIKLRAWLRDVGIMLNVYVLDQTGDAGKGTHFPRSRGWSEHGGDFVFNIDDADLMQFTRLQILKQQVWEGDILKFELEDGQVEIGVVRFADGGFWTSQKEGDSEELLSDEIAFYQPEIIGNIYQHPEL